MELCGRMELHRYTSFQVAFPAPYTSFFYIVYYIFLAEYGLFDPFLYSIRYKKFVDLGALFYSQTPGMGVWQEGHWPLAMRFLRIWYPVRLMRDWRQRGHQVVSPSSLCMFPTSTNCMPDSSAISRARRRVPVGVGGRCFSSFCGKNREKYRASLS